MNLLIYSHAFAPSIGGVETYVRCLADGLLQYQAQYDRQPPSVITLVTNTPADTMHDNQFRFRVVRKPSRRQLWHLVFNADVLHIAGPAALPMWFAILARKPFVVEHDGYQSNCPNGLLLQSDGSVCPEHFARRRYGECIRCNNKREYRLMSALQLLRTWPRRWLCTRASANVSGTQHVLNRIKLPREQMLPHGIAPAGGTVKGGMPVLPEEPREGIPVFAFIGRMVTEKGIRVLLEAAANLKREGWCFRLRLIGGGPERSPMEVFAVKIGLNSWVEWCGPLSGQPLQSALRDVAAVVMPSIWEEAAPLMVLEQMMAGRLLIVSDQGGQAEEVGDTGLRFTPGDALSLAERMQEVLRQPETAKELGAMARARALQLYTQDGMVRGHLKLYRKLINDPTPVNCS